MYVLPQAKPKKNTNEETENDPTYDASNNALDDDVPEPLGLPVLLELLPRRELLVDLHCYCLRIVYFNKRLTIGLSL